MRKGFTLLEIIISIVILSIVSTVAWQTFSAATSAWTRTREMMDQTHHGDFVLTQLSASLRSMFISENSPEIYGFRIDDGDGEYGDHSISWVTSSKAFIPRNSEFEFGMHRIEIGGGEDDDGNEGLLVSVWSHFADEEEIEKKNWVVSEAIRGLSCQVYNIEDEDWDDDWEYSNAIPGLIEITLYGEPASRFDNPIEYKQLIEIPLGPPVTNEVDAP